MCHLENIRFCPISMINHDDLQRVDLYYTSDRDAHLCLHVSFNGQSWVENYPFSVMSGDRFSVLLLPPPPEDRMASWRITTEEGVLVAQGETLWKKPREWSIYVMVSSHTDIGLHNAQYIQRYNSEKFLDQAMELCDQTDQRAECDRYRYTVEGTWFWNNYGEDRGEEAARRVVENYVRAGKIGVCAGVAGNHTQTYGLEEMCRSAYSRQWLQEKWGIDCRTMTMIDNNGLSWGLVQPYADAGFENIFFSPNHWNPLPSTVWEYNTNVEGYTWNCDAGGGGSRIDIRYDSAFPMVFYWENATADKKLLVCSSTQYGHGGEAFGLHSSKKVWLLREMENKTASQLIRMEKRYPYDMWLIACYSDDQTPSLVMTDQIADWNAKWKYPRFRTAGNLDDYFRLFREKFDAVIPTLRGEIAGGWYQHPVAAPELLAAKFEADRTLPTAEKWSALAAWMDEDYVYPQEDFSRAWSALVCNDEHSYGTSGYQGSRVFETWMQHRDWIEGAQNTAQTHIQTALQTLAKHVSAEEDGLILWNPTLQTRSEWIETDGKGTWVTDIPSFGYKVVPLREFQPLQEEISYASQPPVVENDFYRLTFAPEGGIASIFDKALARELLNPNRAPANTFLYTNDNHKTFTCPELATFTVKRTTRGITVIAKMEEPISGASLTQTVSLPHREKTIEIDNRLDHIMGLFNKNRYYRYAYYAFPFQLPGAKRLCHLNGCTAEYGKDNTGHATDVYMPAREWCCMEKDGIGIGWMQMDSQLVEFDHIHPDKTDYGRVWQGAELYNYIANDWLQMHTTGGREINLRLRYQITSYEGNYLQAKLPEMAERRENPLQILPVFRQKGDLPSTFSFLSSDGNERLLTLKPTKDGDRLVARLYDNTRGYAKDQNLRWMGDLDCKVEPLSVAETPIFAPPAESGYRTLALGKREHPLLLQKSHPPLKSHPPIGSFYTGLITKPRATCSEHPDQMYLLWGQSMEPGVEGYELYRGETADFLPDAVHFVAKVEPGVYRVVRYEDRGLEQDHRYYYRVRTCYTDGQTGEFTHVFTGKTREAEWVEPQDGRKIQP